MAAPSDSALALLLAAALVHKAYVLAPTKAHSLQSSSTAARKRLQNGWCWESVPNRGNFWVKGTWDRPGTSPAQRAAQ